MVRTTHLCAGLFVWSLILSALANGQDTEPEIVKLCAVFSIDARGPIADPVVRSGYRFETLGASGKWMIADGGATKIERGLQFLRDGMQITLPAAVPVVNLRLGVFASEVKIEALDKNKKVIHVQSQLHGDDFADVTVKGGGPGKFKYLRITGGEGEGNLASICVTVKVEAHE
jgi:hypothetical protein